ncbi:MAG: TrkH family potassium uptake protein, partial [Clostridia bacterium]|nr:TrkH family potassium uptake protein [Clostridia bacterium]
MNYSIIRRTLGFLLLFEAIFFLLPLITAVIYWEAAFFAFLISIAVCALVGGALIWKKPKDSSIYTKEAFVIVALGWIVMSLFGALPFCLSGEIPSYVDALFETVSGFTTTGATIMNSGAEVETLSKSILMWRSFTHWIGGMGVLVFIMAFLPLSGAKNLQIMKAESPGPEVSKFVPKIRQTAKILYLIYTALTLTQLVLMVIGGMPFFDAITTAFGTAGTGGFAVKGDSMAGYSVFLQVVITVFMLLFSVNFNSYYLLGRRKWKEALNTEVKVFFIIVFSA